MIAGKKTISFHTFGCRLNQAETAALQNSFEASGYCIVPHGAPAQIVVINTCTVTAHGDADTRRLVHKISRLHPNSRIALIGCQSQIQKDQLLQLPNVRWVVGTERKMDLADIISTHLVPETPLLVTPAVERKNFTIPFAGTDRQHTRANIKIQDGCDFFCSFCEIPYARGRSRSRQFDDVLREANVLADKGCQEVVLTGINLGSYSDEGKDILAVIDEIAQISSIKRIRLSSIELTTFTEKIFDRMIPKGKLCRYLHVPLQHGSDKILKLMNRRYQGEEYKRFVEAATQAVPEICLGTDIIAGFPGEAEQDFVETQQLLKTLPIAYLHVFSYSKRHLARSKNLPAPVNDADTKMRSHQLRGLSRTKRHQFFSQFLGQTVPVLFEEQKDGYWSGVTDNYIRVIVKSDEHLHNQWRSVHLDTVAGQSVCGTLFT